MTPTEFIYNTPLWRVRRLGDGWYQGETPLWPAPTTRTRDHAEARGWITTQVDRLLATQGYQRGDLPPVAAEIACRELAGSLEWPQDAPGCFAGFVNHGAGVHIAEQLAVSVRGLGCDWWVWATRGSVGLSVALFQSQEDAAAFAGRLREFLGLRPVDDRDPDAAAEDELDGMQDPRYI